MAEFVDRITIRIGTTEYPISVSEMSIEAVPQLNGAPAFVTDISGVRKTNFRSSKFYLDGIMTFEEHGFQWTEWIALAQALLSHTTLSTDRIDISLEVPYNASVEIQNIIIPVDKDLLKFVISSNIRIRPSSLVFKEANPRSVVPSFMIS